MTEFEQWYPAPEDNQWAETPEQTAERVSTNASILGWGLGRLYPEGAFASYKRVIKNEDGTFSRSLVDCYGWPVSIDASDPSNPTALFDVHGESIINTDSQQIDENTFKVNERFEQILDIQHGFRVALIDTVDLACSDSRHVRINKNDLS